jgi:hypothetical protein
MAMLIAYNDKSDIYRIDLMYPETEIYIKANDIVEAREFFIKHMTWMFDEAVREKLKLTF